MRDSLIELIELIQHHAGQDSADTFKIELENLKDKVRYRQAERAIGVLIERLAFWKNIRATFPRGETEQAQIAPYMIEEIEIILSKVGTLES